MKTFVHSTWVSMEHMKFYFVKMHLNVLETYSVISSLGVKGKVNVENEHGLVVSADDPELMDKLSHAAEKGVYTI